MTERLLLTRAASFTYRLPGRLAWARAVPIAIGVGNELWFGDRLAAVLIAGALIGGSLLAARAAGTARRSRQAAAAEEGACASIEIRNDRTVTQLIGWTIVAAIVAVAITGDGRAFSAVLFVVATYGINPGTRIALLSAAGGRLRRQSHRDVGDIIQALSSVEAVVFDVAALVTSGEWRVRTVYPATGASVREVLDLAASAESEAVDPIGVAIVRHAASVGVHPDRPAHVLTKANHYVRALVGGDEVLVGDAAFVPAGRPSKPPLDAAGSKTVFVMRGDRYVGTIVLGPPVKPEIGRAISALRSMKLTTRLVTLESEAAADAIARDVGIDRYEAGLTVAQHAERVRALRVTPTVAVVGDGMTWEAGDRAVIASDLCDLVDAIARARHARAVIEQNVVGTLLVDTVGIGFAAAGVLTPMLATAVHVACDVAALANASRMASPGFPAQSVGLPLPLC